jgi:uncharacterized protein YkwD
MTKRILQAIAILALAGLPAMASASDLTSQVRQKAGLPGVQVSQALTRAAQRHADYMATSGIVGHKGPRGEGSLQRARAAGFNACRVAENVARGYATEQQAMQAFLNSPKHRRNVLNRRVREVGVASARDGAGQVYWTMILGTAC